MTPQRAVPSLTTAAPPDTGPRPAGAHPARRATGTGLLRHGPDAPPTGTGTSRGAGVRTVLRDLVQDLVRLVVPLCCAGCGEPDVVVCEPCRAALGAGARRADQTAPRLARLPPDVVRPAVTVTGTGGRAGTGGAAGMDDPGGSGGSDGVAGADGLVSRWPVLAGVAYAGVVRSLVGSWKDRGRTDCTPLLTERFRQVARAGRAVVGRCGAGGAGGVEVWVVPAPSTPAAVRRRGREPTTELARAALAALAGAGEGSSPPDRDLVSGRAARVRLVRALGHRRRQTLDQAGLGARDRASNLSGALRVRRRHRGRRTSRRPVVCVLVDDVLTTGATLAECERALAEVGLPVVLGLVLAAAPGPGEAVTPSSQGLVVHSGRRSG